MIDKEAVIEKIVEEFDSSTVSPTLNILNEIRDAVKAKLKEKEMRLQEQLWQEKLKALKKLKKHSILYTRLSGDDLFNKPVRKVRDGKYMIVIAPNGKQYSVAYSVLQLEPLNETQAMIGRIVRGAKLDKHL